MPLYQYECVACGSFDLREHVGRDIVPCPACLQKSKRVYTPFAIHNYHFARTDGEGFTSVAYHPQEYKERVRNNMSKEDKI